MNHIVFKGASSAEEIRRIGDGLRLDVLYQFRRNVRETLDAHFVATSAAMQSGEPIPRPTLTPIDHALHVAGEDLDWIGELERVAYDRLGVRS